MPSLFPERIQAYRSQTFSILPHLRLTNREQAVEFVNRRGFVFFWPNKEFYFPSLWAAAAGDRPVPDEHDDPGHVTWDWKDSLLGKRRWYYARVIRRRNTMISLEIVPYFYALSENYGSPEEDYLLQYEEGRMTLEAKLVYEALLANGALDTISLRKAAHLSSPESDARFNRALEDLQIDFKILPVGVSEAGAWHYAFIYDLVPRHFPNLPEQARLISERAAHRKLAELFWRSLGAARLSDLMKCFRWKEELAQGVVDQLVGSGTLCTGLEWPGQPGEWIVLKELTDS
ncbi:MAG: winged helix DNA-binding domain-containing protein [Chloroflexi bacterium]|nr:winged helix DNA-binding domain-containing protein [Chloroflexota bacterium]